MIRMKDAALLAYTKLRTRKLRLIVTIVISGLLLSVLAGASFVVRGTFNSLESFNEEGFGKRYILSASSNSVPNVIDNQSVIDRAIVIQKDLIVRKKIAAKELGIEYDSALEPPVFSEQDGPDGKTRTLNTDTYSAKQAVAEYLTANPAPGIPELKKSLDKYSPKGYYTSLPALMGQETPYLQVLKNNTEDYSAQTTSQNPYDTKGIASFVSSWGLMSNELLMPFLLPGTTTVIRDDGVIPVVAPYTAVEELLLLEPLPAGASSSDRLARIQEVRKKAPNLAFSVCYRNKTSGQMLSEAISQQQELLQNKDNKNYRKPSVIKDIPAEPCGTTKVVQDTRTNYEKTLAAKEKTFSEMFGTEPESATTMNFRVIGIAPDPPGGASAGVGDLLTSLVGSYIGTSWYTPIELRESQPQLAKLFATNMSAFSVPETYYAELSDSDTARTVLEKENCSPDFSASNGIDPFVECTKNGVYFTLTPFGSSSLALESAQRGFQRVFSIAATAVAVIAALILVGTVGRIIADSRRETAVFRAIGAKRIDIAQIYVTFTIFLTLLISLFALLAGFMLSQIAQMRFGDSLTIDALVVYNAQDLTKEFGLFAFEPKDLLRLLALTVLAGLISAVLPIMNNLRRSPIKDMRDEN